MVPDPLRSVVPIKVADLEAIYGPRPVAAPSTSEGWYAFAGLIVALIVVAMIAHVQGQL